MSSLKEIYHTAYKRATATIPDRTYSFRLKNQDGKVIDYSIEPSEFKRSLDNKFKSFKGFINKFADHLEGQKNIIAAFASTPISFSDAWNMKAEILNAEDVIALSKAGGHFQFNQIPNGVNRSGSSLYQNNYPKGLVKSKGLGITKGFRHKTGGIYDDSLNEMGVFSYDTPTDPSGMMEYRFAEKFSKELGIPLIYIITQWFGYDTKSEDLNRWLYMTGVAKVISDSNHPHDKIDLQLISKEEAIKTINNLLEAIQTKGQFRIRPPMPEHIRLGWSYSKIKLDRSKRESIINYAIEHNMRCPGDKCNHKLFKDLRKRDIHIGHRISQNWNSQNSGVADVHHPYNLYLTCAECNISLSDKYPTEVDKLINKVGTIGDWLMDDMLAN